MIRALALLLLVCFGASAQEEIPLRQYVDALFAAQDKAVSAALAAQKEGTASALAAADRAVTKAETATERRFENSNEWRNTVETLQRTYMPRTESEQRMGAIEQKLQEMIERVNARDAQLTGQGQTWSYVIAAIGVVGIVFGIFYPLIKTRKEEIRESRNHNRYDDPSD